MSDTRHQSEVQAGEADERVANPARRRALARLGLSAAAAYSAPTLLRIDRSAQAQIFPTPCPPPGSQDPRPPGCIPGHGSPGGGPPPGGGGPPGGGPPGNKGK
jgi:hypothetical protein